jgi:hypothetical protein
MKHYTGAHTRNDFFPPLCDVDFDWRCTKFKKWKCAINILMIANHDADITRSEQALVEGEIGILEYADQSQHSRIYAIKKIVKDLRDSYDPFWKPDMLAVNQRAIFAVCSITTYCPVQQHSAWVTDFVATCEEQGVTVSTGEDYQTRLEIYQTMPPLHEYKEGLSMSFHYGREFDSARTPADFEREDPTLERCHRDDCFRCSISEEEETLICSRCKAVSYCSKECQMNDWPSHKKHCNVLGVLCKDKVSEIVQKLQTESSSATIGTLWRTFPPKSSGMKD